MILRFAKLPVLLTILLLLLANARAGIVNAVYNSAADVPVTSGGNYDATGITVNFTLNFAPTVSTNLTVVKLTGLGAINNTFSNLAQNQAVALNYNGQVYGFVANYCGGPDSNDLVLQWSGTRAMAWGNDGNGQLGNGVADTTRSAPVAVTSSGVLAGKTIIALSAGGSHSLALCSDGTVAAWGSNSAGQIGSNGGSQSTAPVIVSTLGALSTKRVIAVAAGASHSLALCSDGTVAGWGLNTSGQLGNGGGGSTGTPTPVNTSGVLSGAKVVAIAAGQNHSMALLSTGVVVTWGANASGQLGIGITTTASSFPVLVNTSGPLLNKTVVGIAAGQLHCLALCSDGSLMSWGENADGQLGNNSPTPSNVPVKVTISGTALATKTVTDIKAGGFHSLALCSDGTVAAWGQNTFGQLGIASGSHYVPSAVATSGTALANKTVTAISGGYQHSLALCSDGTLTAWGLNSLGELGTGNTTTSGAPVAVSTTTLLSGEQFQLPASGANALHTLAIIAFPYTPVQYTTGTLISNGSFESGFANWTVSDINGPFSTLKVSANGFSPYPGLFTSVATDGTLSATSGFDGSGPGVIRLSHDVAVTSATPFIRFDWRAGWDMLNYGGSTLARTFAVNIEPVGGGTVMQSTVFLTAAAHTKNPDTGAQTGFVDLTAFTGTTVRVCFDLTVPESQTGPGFFQLDNVRIAALQPASVNPITRAATALALDGAMLNATVNAGGLDTTVEYEYGKTTGYGGVLTDPAPFMGTGDTASSVTVSGLSANTTYHYRVKTINSAGTKYGADATFTTLPPAPLISDFGNSFLTNSSATFYATVEPNGASTVVTFEYGTTNAYGSSTPAWESPVTAAHSGAHGQISGLTGGATYHWRVKAQNAGGVTYSADATYTPDPGSPGDPTLTTLPPTLVDRSSAMLQALVNANGSKSQVDFQFGTTTNYGTTVSISPGSVSGSADTAIAAPSTGLSPGTTYHCRIRAFGPNSYYIYGPDVTFTTPPIGFPAASTDAATNITQANVLLHSHVSANNGPLTAVSFEYGPDTNYGSAAIVGNIGGLTFAAMPLQIPVSGSAVTYHYRVKAKNNIGTTYGQDMTFTTPDVHEARLYGLTFSGGTLSPAFDRNVTNYTVSQTFETTSFSLTPTASTAIGSVLVNGVSVPSGGTSAPTALNIGDNVFAITVTALDGVTQQTYTVTVTRAAPVAGNMDLSFNGNGKVITDFGVSYDEARAVAVQSDGRIVVAGSAYNGNDYDFAVARYNPDGTPDTTFGTAGTGRVTTAIGTAEDLGTSMAIQADGKIVVAGFSYNGAYSDFSVVRYNGDGTLDTTFNGTGKAVTTFGGDANAASVAVQSDGKIVVAGSAQNGTDYDFALVRFHGNASTGTPGTLDTTFNGTGKVLTPVGTGDDFITSMALQGDGRIVVAGSSNNSGSVDCALARYNSDGTLDTTFNGTGKVSTNLNSMGDDVFNAVAVQSDGKIVAAGYATNGANYDFAVARYHGDASTGAPGTLDTTFNGTGNVITPVGTGDDIATGVLLQGDGKIVATGYSSIAGNLGFAAARYTAAGIRDTTFNGTGTTTTDFGIGSGYALSAALQDDGKILVAGYDTGGFFEDFALVRYLGDGPAIAVQTGDGTGVFDGISAMSFPGVLPGAASSLTFTIQNTGTANLTGLGITVDGTDSSAFSVTASPVAPVSPFGGTTFTVQFLPASTGSKTAALHIASNVAGSNGSYDIALKGAGLTVLENWRQQFLGTADNTGNAADNADPYQTGVPNLAVFAFFGPNQNPSQVAAGQLPQPHFDTAGNFAGGAYAGANYVITFTQPAGVSGVTYGAQWCADLTVGNWQPISDTGSGGTHTFSVPIGGNTQIFMRLVVTSP